jgi:hypothetical protein
MFVFHSNLIQIPFIGKNNDELLDGANKIQDLTLDSLGRTRGMIEASKEVGAATIEGRK